MRKKWISVIMLSVVLSSTLQTSTSLAADGDLNLKSGTTDIGKNTTVKTGDLITYDQAEGMHKKLYYSFIDDKNHNKKLLVLRTKGTIAGKYRVYGEGGSTKSGLAWPSAFKVNVEIPERHKAKISDYFPRNTIETKDYTTSLNYGFNGSINGDSTGKVGGSIGASIGIGHTLKYSQPDYKTVLSPPTDKKVGWTVSFNNMTNKGWGPYNRDSWHATYGNELFMNSRNGWVRAEANFLDPDKISSLMSSGFSPDFAAVVTMDRTENTEKTNIDVTYERVRDDYKMTWANVHWYATNDKDRWIDRSSERYVIDWDNQEITK